MRKLSKDTFLEREERRLRAEIERKEHRLASLRHSGHKSPQRRAAEASASPRRYAEKNYFSFLITAIKDTAAYGFWERILMVFRRFRLISIIFHVISWIFAIVQTGTLFIVFAALAVIALPVLIIGGIIALIRGAIRLRQIGARLKKCGAERAAVIFLPINLRESYNCAASTAEYMASQGYTALVVTPPLPKHKIRSDSVCFVGRGLYFIINKKYLKNTKDRINIYL